MANKFDVIFKNSTAKQKEYDQAVKPAKAAKPAQKRKQARKHKTKKTEPVDVSGFVVPKRHAEKKQAYSYTLTPSNANKLKKLAKKRGYRSSSALLDEILANIR